MNGAHFGRGCVEASFVGFEDWLLFHRLRDEIAQCRPAIGSRVGRRRSLTGISSSRSSGLYVHHLSHVLRKSVPFHLLQLFATLHRAGLVAEGLLFDDVHLTGGIVGVIGGVWQGIGEGFEVGDQFLRRATLLYRLGACRDSRHEIRVLDLSLVSLAGPEVVPKWGRFD